jgi:ABC-type hemin transport system ATPase subunit
VQETRYGRVVLAESHELAEMVQSVTRYVARRMVERERALGDDTPYRPTASLNIEHEQRRARMRVVRAFCYGVIGAVVVLVAIALLTAPRT